MKASHFLVRQESGKEAPGPSVPLKNTNSNANNWRICVFLTRHSDGPGTPTANEVAFSVARETARMTFARSHAARVPENGIWNRAANLAPAVAGEIISAQRPFRYAKQKPQRPYSPPPALLLLGPPKGAARCPPRRTQKSPCRAGALGLLQAAFSAGSAAHRAFRAARTCRRGE